MYRVYKEYWIEEHYKCASTGGWMFVKLTEAEKFCNKLNSDSRQAYEMSQTINKSLTTFKDCLKFDYKKFLDIPKWKPGMAMENISDEMRNERNHIQEHNQKVIKHNAEIDIKTRKDVETIKNQLLDVLTKTFNYSDDIIKKVNEYLDPFSYEVDTYAIDSDCKINN